MGVKFGMEEWTEVEEETFGPLLHVKFHPHRCNDKGVGPPKLKFLLRFAKMWNINAPQGRIHCAIFTNFAEFLPHFRTRWVLKFGWPLSKLNTGRFALRAMLPVMTYKLFNLFENRATDTPLRGVYIPHFAQI